MRGSPKIKGLKQMSEAVVYFLIGIAQQFKYFPLQFTGVNPDTAPGQLKSVADNIIVLGLHLFRSAVQ